MTSSTPNPAGARTETTLQSTPRRLWLVAILITAGLVTARLPDVRAHVRREFAASDMVGTLPAHDAELAITIGTVAALIAAIVLQILVLGVAAFAENRTRAAGTLVVAHRHLSLAFLAVTTAMIVAQFLALVLGLSAPRTSPVVLAAVAAVAVASALVVREARWGVPRRLGFSLALAALTVLI